MTTPEEWDQAFAAASSGPAATAGSNQRPQPVFPTVEAFVNDYLAQLIRRRHTRDFVWCAQWWRHGEAISRLEAIWRAWESLRLDGTTGMSVWWSNHFEPHFNALTDIDRSTFAECLAGHTDTLAPLPVDPAPDGWWGTDDPQPGQSE